MDISKLKADAYDVFVELDSARRKVVEEKSQESKDNS